MKHLLYIIICAALLCSCTAKKEEKVVAPWGEVSPGGASADGYDLPQIVAGGEMIMLTLSGPDTYYEYRGRRLGTQYLVCQRLAERLGVSLRVETCHDTLEIVRRLASGDGDLAALPLPRGEIRWKADSLELLIFCGAEGDTAACHWLVGLGKEQLASEISAWYRPAMLAEARRQEARMFSAGSVRRRVYSPMLNRKGGVISQWDALFVAYSRPIRWDWRLMAAQCYQESTFDPQARSWAGACGLMQIMPSTARSLGLPMEKIHDPESNIAAAAKYLGLLDAKFSDVRDREERTNFVLASYNGGFFHIRDAMTLAEKYGGNPHRWSDVAKYVLLLSQPAYYRDPAVKHGYMRGSETVGYVAKIRHRYQSYGGVRTPSASAAAPQKATHRRKKKYDI